MKERKHHFSLECTGHIVTIYSDTFRPEPKPKPKQHQGNPRNKMSRDKWVEAMRKLNGIKAKEPADMEPHGMIPFGQYGMRRRKRRKPDSEP